MKNSSMNLKYKINKYLPLDKASEDKESSGLIQEAHNNAPQSLRCQVKNTRLMLSFTTLLFTLIAIAFLLGWQLHPRDPFPANTWGKDIYHQPNSNPFNIYWRLFWMFQMPWNRYSLFITKDSILVSNKRMNIWQHRMSIWMICGMI